MSINVIKSESTVFVHRCTFSLEVINSYNVLKSLKCIYICDGVSSQE